MAVNNTLVKDSGKKPAPFSAVISSDNYKKLINNTLRDPKRANSFVASVTSAVSANPALQKCDAASIVSTALLGESLNLSPSPQLGQYYMVPYKQKAKYDRNGNMLAPEKSVAQFQMGYRGYIQLAMRSGQYLDIDAIEIREGECKGRNKATGKYEFEFIEDDDIREELPVIGYLAYFELLNGFKKSVYFSKTKMMKHADTYSQAFSAEKYRDLLDGKIPQNDMWKYSSFWYKNFDAMAFKTVLRQLLSKYGIMSVEMQKAFDGDMGSINEDGSVDYVDNSEEFTPDNDPNVIDVDPETGEVVGVSHMEKDPTAAFFGDEG